MEKGIRGRDERGEERDVVRRRGKGGKAGRGRRGLREGSGREEDGGRCRSEKVELEIVIRGSGSRVTESRGGG